MALKYEPGDGLLAGDKRRSTYEAVFIPLRPLSEFRALEASISFGGYRPLYSEINVHIFRLNNL